MDEFKSAHFVTSDGVRLHYLDAGSGPPLVFVPGWTMPAWIWEPQLSHFSASHRVVALDPRGGHCCLTNSERGWGYAYMTDGMEAPESRPSTRVAPA